MYQVLYLQEAIPKCKKDLFFSITQESMPDASGQSIFKNDRKEFEEKMGRFKALLLIYGNAISFRKISMSKTCQICIVLKDT